MKKLYFVLITFVLLASCKPIPRLTLTYVDDFRKYTEAGFFISPNPYNGQFDPIGNITITVHPGYKKYPYGKQGIEERNKNQPGMKVAYYYTYEVISNDELLKLITDKAKEMGANALVNYKATITYHISDGFTKISYYNVEGFAIKTK